MQIMSNALPVRQWISISM